MKDTSSKQHTGFLISGIPSIQASKYQETATAWQQGFSLSLRLQDDADKSHSSSLPH